MDQSTIRHIWEAFSSLSDAQDHLATSDTKGATDRINHAKEHLVVVLHKAPEEERLEAIMAALEGCSLPKEGQHGS